jgi:hypothetical protein
MQLKSTCKRTVIIGAIVIGLIKLAIRPFFHFDQPLQFLLGIAPNLIGSFLLPFGAVWFFNGRYFLAARMLQINSIQGLRQLCLFGMAMLIVNEYLQLIPVFGRTFDYYDILFSVAGLTTSYFIFKKIFERSYITAA